MSIQTVQAKKRSGGLTLLVALLVMAAGAMYTFRDASANVTAADFDLTGGCAATAQVGDTCSYTVAISALTQPSVGDIQIVVNLDDDLGNITNINSTGLPSNAACVVSGAGNDVITCTLDGPIPAAATGTLTFDAVVKGPGDITAGQGVCTANDLGSAQGPQPCDNALPAVTVEGPNFSTVLKDTVDQFQTVPLDPVYLTERFVYQVTIFNGDAANGAEDLSFSDTLPASVDAVSATATISGGAAATGNAASCGIASDVVTCTGLDIAANTVAVDGTAPFTASANQIVISIPVQMRGDATFGGSGTVSSTDITNTGTFTCNSDGALSGALLVCDDGSPSLTQTYVATDSNLTPQRVLLNDDNTAVEDTASCSISTSNFAGGRVVGNVTSLTDTDLTDWSISPATYTAASVSGAAGAEQTLAFTPSEDGTYTITFFWNAQNNSAGGAVVEATATCDVAAAAAVNDDTEDLFHIDPFGDPSTLIDVENNVIGYLHEVCAANMPVDSLFPTFVDQVHGQGEEQGYNFKIQATSGTPNIIGPVISTLVDCDGDGFADDSTITWYSTQTGEQSIEVVNDSGEVIMDSSGMTAPFTEPLIKEWNTLLPTTITAVDIEDGSDAGGSVAEELAAATNYDGQTVSLGAVLNPATGIYEVDSKVFYENVPGSHITNTGSTLVTIATGATVTFTVDSDCGYVALLDDTEYADALTAYNDGTVDDTYVEGDYVRTIRVTSVGESISFAVTSYDADMNSDEWDCSILDIIEVDIQAAYPASVLGSVVPTNPALETIRFQLTHRPAAKQVLLAWAGQRIILEHDWRLVPGDLPDLTPAYGNFDLDNCPFPVGTDITYVKGSGPGNFLTGLDVDINGSDQAWVELAFSHVDQIGDVPGYPQNACITRVLYESEDPGQVDIEAFVDETNTVDYSKVAFVIYYMKFNTVDLSLVTQVSKPTHNGSAAGYRDYAPGNPWDATADDADGTADWNVSRDILVRGRVSGWFVNENPSGRAADTSDEFNVLPANRWIMPIDWPMLAGGPRDPENGSDARGTAEEFRPYYNLLFAPNNVEGIALFTPEGLGANMVALVAAIPGVANTGATFGVSTFAGLSNGVTVYVGASTTARTATLNANGTITVSPALAAAPAAGTPIFVVSGVPFEGPYSLIDIPGLAVNNGSNAGAALSNIPGTTNSATRDTILVDSDIDWWDAPMPPAMVSVKIRGAGFIKQVLKDEVYYIGTANSAAQVYPNPFYIANIPDSGFIPAVVAGGGYLWNSWGNDGPAAFGGEASSVDDGLSGDGPYRFWEPAVIGGNSQGVMDTLVSNPASAKAIELEAIRDAYIDDTIARDLVVYSDNHGEFMVTANGDFNLTYDECDTNTLGGGKLCAPGDKVGSSTVTSTADYPDFRGKHFPVASNAVTVNWIWGGYKDVTIEPDPNEPQIAYVVFHAVDRDGFCNVPVGAVSLHSVLTSYDTTSPVGGNAALGNQVEVVDFLIDSDEGGIILDTNAGQPPISVTKEFASGVSTFSTAVNTTIREFPNSDLAASETADECQAWIRISNSLLAITNVLVVAHNDPPEGNVTFDRIVDFSDTATVTLNVRWSLVTWTGSDDIPVEDALKGTGLNEGGSDIFDQVTAVYGWDAAAQDWLGYFPAGVGVPGANDLTALEMGQAYWIAIKGPSSVTWTIETNVDQ
ncbi:MAG: hypothetical protein IT303_15540 [Dehalococcoidia bacterium]|nr:hypothetical protein [Dehalococcoidia bacterium]